MGSTGGRNETFPEDRGRENKGQEVGVLQQEQEREMGGGITQKWLTQLVIQFNLAKAMLNCEHSMKLNQADKFRHVDCEDQGNWTQSIAKPLRQNVCSNNM